MLHTTSYAWERKSRYAFDVMFAKQTWTKAEPNALAVSDGKQQQDTKQFWNFLLQARRMAEWLMLNTLEPKTKRPDGPKERYGERWRPENMLLFETIFDTIFYCATRGVRAGFPLRARRPIEQIPRLMCRTRCIQTMLRTLICIMHVARWICNSYFRLHFPFSFFFFSFCAIYLWKYDMRKQMTVFRVFQ